MASDGQIVFEVTADGKHAIADIKEITRAIQQETGKWDDAAGKASDGIESKFSGMLKKLAAGFSAVKIGKALLDLGKDAIEAASALEEVQNVVDVTFGSNANQIETWAKNAGTQFGLTETQAKKFTSTMGAMLKSSGLAGEEIVDVSTDLAGLAADMASFYNLDFEEAFSKIRSGMSGMTMPLKELGIDMSVDTMNAFALSQGLKKTFNEMSQSEQTMLRYQYLMSATADAQGDFARTSDGYANSVRQLQTNLTTLKTNLGTVLIDVVNPLISGINELFKDRSGEKTVLDDFAGIDEQTEKKLAAIQEAANSASLLTSELDRIAGSKADKAGSKLQQMTEGLANIDLDQGKAGIVKDFVSSLAKDIPTLANIQGTSNEEAIKWLEGIREEAEKLTPEDAQGWETLLNTIKEGLPGIENTDFGASFFAALGSGFSDVEKQSSLLQWAVDSLGDKTNKTAEEQALWLETCKRLVKTIPGLSSIINTETGEIKGGTQAVKDYIKAWEEGQTKLVYLQMHQEKGTLLEQAFADLPRLELEAKLAAWRMKNAFSNVQDIYKKYGWGLGFDQSGNIDRSNFNAATDDERKALNAFADEVEKSGLAKAYREATDAYNTHKKAHDDAVKMYEEEGRAIEDIVGKTETATDETAKFYQENAENIKGLVSAAQEAVKAMDDYVQNVREGVASSVDSTVKGFEYIGNAAQRQEQRLKPILKEIDELDKSSKTYEQDLKKLQGRMSDANDVYGVGNMTKNLQSQLAFLKEYKADMEAARAAGFSNEFLAQFADGSQESAEWLHEIAQLSAGDDRIKELNDLYAEIGKGKEELTQTLTEQKLSIDEVYNQLAADAKKAVDELNLAVPAEQNSGETIAGMAKGISDHIPDVKEAVDGIIAQLDRLNGYGISIDLGGFGKITFTTSTGENAEGHRFGLASVPFDGYLARLHEGERVLTAEENQVWNMLTRGGVAGFDLESLGGVMRDNIKPGGNVYLDGKVVGNVISDRQGRAYRSLQRSGWQT